MSVETTLGYGKQLLKNTFGRGGLEWGRKFTQEYPVSNNPTIRALSEKLFSNLVHLYETAMPLASRGLVRNAPDFFDKGADYHNSITGLYKKTVVPIAAIGADVAGLLATTYVINAAQGSTESAVIMVGSGFLAKVGVNAASHAIIDIYQKVSKAVSSRTASVLSV
jgi:hypothetical protein